MKKTSTVRVNGNMIFKGHKLTIGLDLGDRSSKYRVLDEAGEILLEQKLATTPEAVKQTFERIPRSYRPGDRNTFPVAKPAVKRAGTRGARGARAKGAIDHQEQSKR